MSTPPTTQQAPSSPNPELAAASTKHKAAASKAFLENHYKSMLKGLSEPNRGAIVKPREREIKVTDFELIKLIGRGAFGEVYLCRKCDDPPGHPLRAMKRMRKVDMLRMKQIYHVRSERNVMAEATVANPWVVELQFSFQDENYLYMVMEYTPGGDMMSWLIAKEIFSDDETRFYIAELALAVHSVHQMKYVHRDLKPDNVLIDSRGHIKLSDFGLCRRFQEESDELDFYAELEGASGSGGSAGATSAAPATAAASTEPFDADFSPPNSVGGVAPLPPSTNEPMEPATPPPAGGSGGGPLRQSQQEGPPPAVLSGDDVARRQVFESVVGSPGYIAPEILRKQRYGISCDWWSVGVIMYEMLYGCPPFYAQENHVTQHKILNWSAYLRFPPASAHGPVSKEAIDLMRRLLCDMKDRADWDGIRTHPFFRSVDWDTLPKVEAPFRPQLSSPTDTRYFPELDDRQRIADAQHVNFMKELDPRGVLFADFGFKPPTK